MCYLKIFALPLGLASTVRANSAAGWRATDDGDKRDGEWLKKRSGELETGS
jgi:hypothetical protein